MSDLISRQAALAIVFEYAKELYKHVGTPEDNVMYSYGRGILLGIERNLKELPPSEPKRGKWIYHIDDLFPAESTMECNQCHAEQPLICDDEFCPKCGAKMEGTE